MNSHSPEFTSLLGAALWWRDYATNLSEGRAEFPTSPYPVLYEYTPYPPSGVTPETPKFAMASRIAVDAAGYCWRVFDPTEDEPEGMWSMCPVNPNNEPIPQPVTYYVPIESHEGMVTIYDHEGKYLGCIGIATWQRILTEWPAEK